MTNQNIRNIFLKKPPTTSEIIAERKLAASRESHGPNKKELGKARVPIMKKSLNVPPFSSLHDPNKSYPYVPKMSRRERKLHKRKLENKAIDATLRHIDAPKINADAIFDSLLKQHEGGKVINKA